MEMQFAIFYLLIRANAIYSKYFACLKLIVFQIFIILMPGIHSVLVLFACFKDIQNKIEEQIITSRHYLLHFKRNLKSNIFWIIFLNIQFISKFA